MLLFGELTVHFVQFVHGLLGEVFIKHLSHDKVQGHGALLACGAVVDMAESREDLLALVSA